MPKRQTLDALQIMRAIGAVLVVFDHCLGSLQRNAGATGLEPLAWALGNVGVYLFFVVSGFVMIYAHGQDFGVAGSPARFALRRIGRVLPTYWLFTMLAIINVSIVKHKSLSSSDIVASLLFIPYHGDQFFGQPVLGQGWTLNYEMLFYLIFGISTFFRSGLWMVFGFFGGLVTAGLIGAFAPDTIMHFWASPITLFFLAGIVLGLLRDRWTWRISCRQALAFTALLVPLAVASHLLGGNHLVTHMTTGLLVIAAVTASVLSRPARPGRFARIARELGDATYSTYLAHTFLVGGLSRMVTRPDGGLPALTSMLLIGAVVSIGAGIVICHCIERPLLKLWARATSPGHGIPMPAA